MFPSEDKNRLSSGAAGTFPTRLQIRWLRLGLAFMPAYAVVALLTKSGISTAFKIEIILVLAATALRPSVGLLVVAALAPLGDMMVPLLGSKPVAHAEALVLAFFAAWLASFAAEHYERPVIPAAIAGAMSVFGWIIVTSAATTSLQLHREAPDSFYGAITSIADGYLVASDPIGAHGGAILIEGLALVLAVAELRRRDSWLQRRLLEVLACGGIVAAVGSALLAKGIGPTSKVAYQAFLGIPRYSATIGDVNAAASSYVLLLGISIGLAAVGGRVARIFWLIASIALIEGLWLTGSRTAYAALVVIISVVSVALLSRAVSRTARATAAIVLVVVAVSGIAVSRTRSATSSIDMRAGFTQASLHLIAERPIFGIGIGQYYPLSELVLPPSLAWFYGRENAHDYYLQVAAELGLTGLAAFLCFITPIFTTLVRRLIRSPDRLLFGVLCGLAGYLVTAVAGHPFLTHETSIPFWVTLGVIVDSCGCRHTAARPKVVAAVLAAVLLVSIPFRAGIPNLRLPPGTDGLGPLHVDETGHPFREAKPFCSLYLRPNVTAVEIPLRAVSDDESSQAIKVSVAVPKWATHDIVVGGEWRRVFITLPGASPLMHGERINIATTTVEGGQTRARLLVGPPNVVWTRD